LLPNRQNAPVLLKKGVGGRLKFLRKIKSKKNPRACFLEEPPRDLGENISKYYNYVNSID